MPRRLRDQYPGAIYHVMSRGNRREAIFLDDVDRRDFLKTLAEVCQKTDWQVHAYCLMSKLGNQHSGQLRQETAESKAARIIGEELVRLGMEGEADLLSWAKSDARKRAIAARVRRETTLAIKMIAGRMGLGTSKSANIRLPTAREPVLAGEAAQAGLDLREDANQVMG